MAIKTCSSLSLPPLCAFAPLREHSQSPARLSVKFVDLGGCDALGADAVVGKLLAVGINVNAAGVLHALIDVHDVDVEDECLLAGARDPVNVVLVIRHRGVLAGGERAVERGAND